MVGSSSVSKPKLCVTFLDANRTQFWQNRNKGNVKDYSKLGKEEKSFSPSRIPEERSSRLHMRLEL